MSENKTFIIAGPGTRKKTVEAVNITVGPSGDLQVWGYANIIAAYAHGEWSSFWIERNNITKA